MNSNEIPTIISGAANQPVIEIFNLGKKYRIGKRERYYSLRDTLVNLLQFWKWQWVPKPEFWALKDINLSINQGEALGVIGRNGAGKSTLLKILSQITPPTRGHIKMHGRVASLLEVGTGFNPELTGRENIYLNGVLLGMSRNEIARKFDEIVAFAEIDKFLDTPVKHYSSGMYVRLAFAIAAHLEPEILLVDEVLAVGDAEFQKKCLGKMGEINQSGRTVVFVSHNLKSIRSLCSRAILLQHGEIIGNGGVNEVINQYESSAIRNIALVNWGDTGPKLSHSQLIEVGVLSDGKQVGTELSAESPIQIYIIFRVQQSVPVGATVILSNMDGQVIFVSISNHDKVWHMKNRPVGTYRSVCEIPANLLSGGKYSVEVGLWEGYYDQGIMERNLLYINVSEHGLVRGDLPYEMTQGIIRPLLEWKSERYES